MAASHLVAFDYLVPLVDEFKRKKNCSMLCAENKIFDSDSQLWKLVTSNFPDYVKYYIQKERERK